MLTFNSAYPSPMAYTQRPPQKAPALRFGLVVPSSGEVTLTTTGEELTLRRIGGDPYRREVETDIGEDSMRAHGAEYVFTVHIPHPTGRWSPPARTTSYGLNSDGNVVWVNDDDSKQLGALVGNPDSNDRSRATEYLEKFRANLR